MRTVPQTSIKAKYATMYDEAARIAKVNGALYVIYDDGRIEDLMAGGAAAVACGREEGRQ